MIPPGWQRYLPTVSRQPEEGPRAILIDEAHGRAVNWDGNFKYKGRVDTGALRARVLEQSDAEWNQDSYRQTTFGPHRHTETIPLLFDADFRHANPTAQPKFAVFKTELRPVFEYLVEAYGPGYHTIRCLLTRLGVGFRIQIGRASCRERVLRLV